jgi:hypothetical protein
LQAFDLVILHPDSGVTVAEVEELQAAGVIVLGYVSIGEEPPGLLYTDTMSGPVRYEPGGNCCGVENRHCEYNDYACYYLDEDNDGEPDTRQDGPWGSHFVDAASPYWRDKVRLCNKDTMTDCNFYGTDYVLYTLGCDGLFLDTVDTASPWHQYSYTLDAMADLICTISDWYPDQYAVLNRGIFYADPSYGANVVRPCINGIVFEGYCSVWDWELKEGRDSPWFEDNRDIWAPKLNGQRALTDGYTVFALDYFTPTQQISIAHQISETVERWGWLEYISTPYLDTVRWEVWAYLHHRVYLPVVLKGYRR